MRAYCEVCGSIDLVKDGGAFVCQDCGCKYSVAEIREQLGKGQPLEREGERSPDPFDEVAALFEAGCYQQVTERCDVLLSENAGDYMALLYKAFALSWSSFPKNRWRGAFALIERSVVAMHDTLGDSEHYASQCEKLLSLYLSYATLLAEAFAERKMLAEVESDRVKLYGDYGARMTALEAYGDALSDHRHILMSGMLGYGSLMVAMMAAVNDPWKVGRGLYERFLLLSQEVGDEAASAESKASGVLALMDELDRSEYWSAHPEERFALIGELDRLDARIHERKAAMRDLQYQVDKYPSFKKRKTAKDRIKEELAKSVEELEAKKASLGFFAKKEKISTQEEIDKLKSELVLLETEIEKEVEKQREEHRKGKADLINAVLKEKEEIAKIEKEKAILKTR